MADFRKIDTVPSAPSYAFIRRAGADAVLVVLNLSPNDLPSVVLTPAANAGAISGNYIELFTGKTETHRGRAATCT